MADAVEAPYAVPPRHPRAPALIRIPAGTPAESCTEEACVKRGLRLWKVPHPTTGRLTPLTVAPELTLADGTVVATGAFAPWRDVTPTGAIDRDGLGYSHFVDCPGAARFRTRGAK